MSENREYVSRSDELGNIHISEEVLAGIAAAAALEVDGVSGLAANLGSDIAELLGKKTLAKGVHVQMDEEKVTVDLSVLMAYGNTIPGVGKAVQDAVKNWAAGCSFSRRPVFLHKRAAPFWRKGSG